MSRNKVAGIVTLPTVKETDIEIIKLTDDDEMIYNTLLLQPDGVWLVVDIDSDYNQAPASLKLNLTVPTRSI